MSAVFSQRTHLMSYLDDTVKTNPDKMIFSDGTTAITFRQAWQYSRSIASWLLAQGGGSEPVAVFMQRGPHMPTAFFGVLDAGKYYVPLDQEMPAFRIELILEQVDPRFMICDHETLPIASQWLNRDRILLFDDLVKSEIRPDAIAEARARTLDTDPAYIVFTSGSTGIPKGVVGCHRSVIYYIDNLCHILDVAPDTVFGNQTPLYLDACLKEIFSSLKMGASTYLIPKSLFMFPIRLVEYINQHQINTLCWVVSALTMISGLGVLDKQVPDSLKTIAFASEVFPVKQFQRWQQALPQARFINFYGPTETTGVCCWYEVQHAFTLDEVMPIGRPFPNTDIFLLDEQGKKVKPGTPGEICIRGTSLTLGYYKDPVRTAQSFVINPLNKAVQEIIYKTGDIGIENEAGEFVFISRKDHQIKHMGHRIELGEIETAAAMREGIEQAACLYDKDRQQIWLFYVGSASQQEATASLKEKLPRYMMPHQIIQLDSIPLTSNHKLDRQALQKLKTEKQNSRKQIKPA